VKLPLINQRMCGDCTACCTWLPIPEGVVGGRAKPPGVACPHLSDSGCGIYCRRPVICEHFYCAWLATDNWPDAWRPDRSGLLCLHEILPDGKPGSLVLEIRPGALLAPQAKDILLALMRISAVVVVIGPDGRARSMQGCWDPEAAREASSVRTAA
jgi:hypothetical protein